MEGTAAVSYGSLLICSCLSILNPLAAGYQAQEKKSWARHNSFPEVVVGGAFIEQPGERRRRSDATRLA